MERMHEKLDSPQEAEMLNMERAHTNLEGEKIVTFLFHLPLSLRKRLKALAFIKGANMSDCLADILTKELDTIS
jgi:hypothetical protein